MTSQAAALQTNTYITRTQVLASYFEQDKSCISDLIPGSLKGLVPPRDHEVFMDENHLPGKKVKFFCGKYFSFWMPLQNPISFLGV